MKFVRNFVLFILLSFLLPACTNNANPPRTEKIILTPNPPLPTRFSLGNCIDTRLPTPVSGELSLFHPVNSDDHSLGKADAFVTILVYSDFQCSSCASIAPLLKSFVKKYPKDVRLVFRNFPLISIHDKAALSTQAAEAASLQGKFWEMHDLLYSRQAEWLNLNPVDFQNWIIKQAESIPVNKSQFEADLTSPALETLAQKAWVNGQNIKLPGAPVILINGEILKWQPNLIDQLENLVKLAILPQKQFSSCPPMVIDPVKKYVATLITSKGTIKVTLFLDKAPNTVNNFIFLAQKGWYDNIPFHRVIPGFLAQSGDPTGTGLGGPGYYIPNETNSFVYDRAGMVGMVNSGPDTNGSQFFITLAPAPHLNKDYSIFGQVTGGIEVLSLLTPFDPSNHQPDVEPDTLFTVTIEER